MKHVLILLTALSLLLSLCSCNSVSPDNDGSSNGDVDHMTSVCSKDSVDEFMAIFGEKKGDGLLAGYSITKDNMYNVTPPHVAAKTDYRVFKASDSGASFILIDGEIYTLCEWFGGHGFVNAVPCDFDGDGNTDLLVASSWGSGQHRSEISVFNTVTKKSTVLYTSLEDLIVMTLSPSFSSQGDPAALPIYYQVYAAKITVNDNNFANLSYVVTDVVGSVQSENGTAVFLPAHSENP